MPADAARVRFSIRSVGSSSDSGWRALGGVCAGRVSVSALSDRLLIRGLLLTLLLALYVSVSALSDRLLILVTPLTAPVNPSKFQYPLCRIVF